MFKQEKPLTLKFALEPAIEELEHKILEKHKKSLDKFNTFIIKIFKDDLKMIDSLRQLPQFMLRDGIELALRTALTGEKEYIGPDFYV